MSEKKSCYSKINQILSAIIAAIILFILYGWSQNGRYQMANNPENRISPLIVLDTRTGEIKKVFPQ
ncbi:MAG: hypothetical protein ISS71_02970 [Phycisphaerae bacterium]|nr:hypothetical protein [Phycisphaerae bacterium]